MKRTLPLARLARARLVALTGASLMASLACTPPAPPALAVEACTLETPLVPGIAGSPGHLVPTERNPNGQSELALLMRGMESDLKAVRTALVEGTPVPPPAAPHERIRCSWPTTPTDRTPVFDALAQAYLVRLPALKANPSRESYHAVVEGCVACHQQSCPGPLMAIEGLRLP